MSDIKGADALIEISPPTTSPAPSPALKSVARDTGQRVAREAAVYSWGMDKPGYIVPPPGLFPPSPKPEAPTVAEPGSVPPVIAVPSGVSAPNETSATVRIVERAPLRPVFVPSAQVATGLPKAAPQWSLAMHDGSVIHISETILLGRDPQRTAQWLAATLARVNDPQKSVSKTHAGIDCTSGEFVITDLYSTNGVAVIEPLRAESILEPGVATTVAHGSTVLLGQYRITVARQ